MMKLKGFYSLGIVLIFSLSITFQSCGEKADEVNENDTTGIVSYVSDLQLPANGSSFVKGDKIPFTVVFSDGGKSVVKTDFSINGKNILTSTKKEKKISFEFLSDTCQVLGAQSIHVEVELADGMVEKYDEEIMLVSNLVPESYSYKIVKKYPHDVNAYTQGLVYENGYMYEGTGQYGASQLRLVDFKQNKVLQTQKLDKIIFGEGVAIIGNKIFQLTWQNNKAFVYDKSSFKLLKELDYTTEGWGLTYDGANLILSDGTPVIYFLDPETFAVRRKIVVVDNVSPVGLLNELEYINGEIWANMYQTNFIMRIDPKTGSVISKIDLTGLLTDHEQMEKVDVLNGIAYDQAANKIYVTGKLWPWLFEIELVKNQPK